MQLRSPSSYRLAADPLPQAAVMGMQRRSSSSSRLAADSLSQAAVMDMLRRSFSSSRLAANSLSQAAVMDRPRRSFSSSRLAAGPLLQAAVMNMQRRPSSSSHLAADALPQAGVMDRDRSSSAQSSFGKSHSQLALHRAPRFDAMPFPPAAATASSTCSDDGFRTRSRLQLRAPDTSPLPTAQFLPAGASVPSTCGGASVSTIGPLQRHRRNRPRSTSESNLTDNCGYLSDNSTELSDMDHVCHISSLVAARLFPAGSQARGSCTFSESRVSAVCTKGSMGCSKESGNDMSRIKLQSSPLSAAMSVAKSKGPVPAGVDAGRSEPQSSPLPAGILVAESDTLSDALLAAVWASLPQRMRTVGGIEYSRAALQAAMQEAAVRLGCSRAALHAAAVRLYAGRCCVARQVAAIFNTHASKLQSRNDKMPQHYSSEMITV